MIEIRRGADRSVTHAPGITTWHSFSSGAHYDPGNVGFGALVACDEHRLAPGAGFAPHAHRGLEIITWVLAGTLEHTDSLGGHARVSPGAVAHLSAGSGVTHTERNAGADELRFVQLWLLGGIDAAPAYRTGGTSVRLDTARFAALCLTDGDGDGDGEATVPAAPRAFVFVATGTVRIGADELAAGDEARVTDESATLRGRADLLTVALPASPTFAARASSGPPHDHA